MFFRTQALCALAAVGLFVGVSANLNADPLKVKTEQGKVAGKTISDGKVRAGLDVFDPEPAEATETGAAAPAPVVAS